jgi:hypothetical protein
MANETCAEDIFVGAVKLAKQYTTFTRGNVTNNERENPGFGFTVAYNGGNTGESTIYIYNKGFSEIADGPGSNLVRQEFDQATRDVLAVADHMPGRRVALISRYGTVTPERGQAFLCAEFVLTDVSGSRRTFLYLTGASGNFVKIRVTLRTNDPTDPSARDFADALASQLWRH